jgi:sec-independent protein translocase protein TatB
MFDFAWSEIALIGVVALIAIGPKDLPVAIKAVAEMVKKARRMASEFQTHVDEMVRDANLHEMKSTFDDLRRMDIKGKILDAVDSDHTLRDTIKDNPFDINPAPPPVPVHDTAAALTETTVDALPEHAIPAPDGEAIPAPDGDAAPPVAAPAPPAVPAFIPPSIAASGPQPPKPLPPSFVPPKVVAQAAGSYYATPYRGIDAAPYA